MARAVPHSLMRYQMRGRWQPPCGRYRSQQHSPIHHKETRERKGKVTYRVWNSSTEEAAESVALGSWHRSTTPPRRGWQSIVLEWCYQKLRESVRRLTSPKKLTWGVLVGVITCGGACVSVLAIRPHAVFFVLVFLLFDNLMLEFF